jgi:2-octaprenyl-6-methoxyphenol hydroxylase
MGMSAETEIRCDVIVVGAGPVGALVAALVAQAGLSVAVIEAGAAEIISKPQSDGRAIALALAPKRALEVGGFWPLLAADAQPILDIRVTDGHAPVYLHYDHRTVGVDPFGWIIENEVIKTAALSRLAQLGVKVLTKTTVEHWDFGTHDVTARLSGGGRVRARLAVAADGRRSPTRDAAGIEVTGWDYGQSAIVCAIAHEKPHRGIAHEHFMPAGPFAILPMTSDRFGNNRSGIVWTEARKRAQGIVEQSDAAFLAEMAERFGDFLGGLSLASPRFS